MKKSTVRYIATEFGATDDDGQPCCDRCASVLAGHEYVSAKTLRGLLSQLQRLVPDCEVNLFDQPTSDGQIGEADSESVHGFFHLDREEIAV